MKYRQDVAAARLAEQQAQGDVHLATEAYDVPTRKLQDVKGQALSAEGVYATVFFYHRHQYVQQKKLLHRQLEERLWKGSIAGAYVVKRLGDFTLALALSVVMLPFLLLVMALIRAESYGCAFYGEKCIGQDGQMFRRYQFRTRLVNMPTYSLLPLLLGDGASGERHLLRVRHNEQFTYGGAWLVALHLQRLPQLFNVLLGDMSFIGPLPRVADTAFALPVHVRPGIVAWGKLKEDLAVKFIRKVGGSERGSFHNILRQVGTLGRVCAAILLGRAG